jgi:16S rRNA (guanine527-N7)-methyltransferase
LAIAKPDWSVTLIDSNHKKTAFLRQAVIELKLQNVTVITDRVERVRLQQPADVVISRAFTDLSGFAEAARHLTTQSGILAAMKGVHPHEELDQLSAGTRATRVIPLNVPGLRAARHLVLLQTVDAT